MNSGAGPWFCRFPDLCVYRLFDKCPTAVRGWTWKKKKACMEHDRTLQASILPWALLAKVEDVTRVTNSPVTG